MDGVAPQVTVTYAEEGLSAGVSFPRFLLVWVGGLGGLEFLENFANGWKGLLA